MGAGGAWSGSYIYSVRCKYRCSECGKHGTVDIGNAADMVDAIDSY